MGLIVIKLADDHTEDEPLLEAPDSVAGNEWEDAPIDDNDDFHQNMERCEDYDTTTVVHCYPRFFTPPVTCFPLTGYCRSGTRDHRTWQQRLNRRDSAWKALLPDLVDAYLAWKHDSDGFTDFPTRARDLTAASEKFSVTAFYLFSMSNSLLSNHHCDIFQAHETRAFQGGVMTNIALAQNGLLGTSPHAPIVAISFTTLELFRRCRLRCPQFSIQAFVRVLSDLHCVHFLLVSSLFLHSSPSD